MERFEQVRKTVDAIVQGLPDGEDRRNGSIHLWSVSAFCGLLALSRGLDAEICATAGMLHDLSTYESGDSTDHAERSARRAVQMLTDLGLFSPEEVSTISEAISVHSRKEQIDGPVSEVLKAADEVNHYIYDPDAWEEWDQNVRARSLLAELGTEPR